MPRLTSFLPRPGAGARPPAGNPGRGARGRCIGILTLLATLAWLVVVAPALAGRQAHHHARARHGRIHRHRVHPAARRHRRVSPPKATPPAPEGGSSERESEPPQESPTIEPTVPGGGTPLPTGTALALPNVGIAAGADLQKWPLANVERELNDLVTLHARWVRHDFAWDAIEAQKGVFTWAGFDRWVGAARARSLDVIATVSYTPAWANGGSANHDTQPSSPEEFGRFARQVAERYAPQGVHTYEIWNEPNIGFWQPKPNPARYTNVLCSAYREIRAVDPQATVLTGGSSPAADSATTYSPQTWLTDLYADGAGPCFDAVAHHPYVDSSKTAGDLGNAWNLMYDAYPPSNLRGIMTAHGDAGKRIWATEVGCNREVLGNSECSARIAEALRLWQSFPWAGALCWFTYWDPNVYGLVDGSWLPRPEWFAFRSAASAYP